MKTVFTWHVLFLALLLASPMLQAAPTNQSSQNAPISINANNQEIDIKNDLITFTGNVVITQNNLQLKADKVTIKHLQNNQQQIITAQGRPVYFQQRLAKNQTIKGHANQLKYDVKQGRLVLTGQAKITQQDNLISSNEITYLVQQQKIMASGHKQRVKTVIVPQQVQELKQ